MHTSREGDDSLFLKASNDVTDDAVWLGAHSA